MHFRKDSDIVASYGFDFGLKNEKPKYGRITKSRMANQAGLNL